MLTDDDEWPLWWLAALPGAVIVLLLVFCVEDDPSKRKATRADRVPVRQCACGSTPRPVLGCAEAQTHDPFLRDV
jgi:hypothetical protein